MERDMENEARPFIKWVGGKRSIINELKDRIPENYRHYHEPFIGGGALFFNLRPESAFISDLNRRLIMTYRAIQGDVDLLISYLQIHARNHSKDYYYKVRETFNSGHAAPYDIAASFIYLNKTGFNGLYRENKSGGFNVPMGDYKNPKICDIENLRAVSRSLDGVKIEHADFQSVSPKLKDFYYFDPPYDENFVGYNGGGFDRDKQKDLSQKCRDIDQAGGYFMLSNSDTDFIRDIYKGFLIEEVMAGRSVSRKGSQRGRKRELIIRNYGAPIDGL